MTGNSIAAGLGAYAAIGEQAIDRFPLADMPARSAISLGPIHREPGFSAFDPGIEPRGPYVLVQEYRKPAKSAGGILFTRDQQDFDQAVVAVGLVLSIGAGCFKHSDGEPWAEGPWCAIGDYVNIPKMSDEKWLVGDAEFTRTFGKEGDGAIFRLVRHDQIKGVFTSMALIPTFNKQVA